MNRDVHTSTQAKANNFKAGESLSTLDPHVLPLSKGGIRIYDAVSDVVESGVQSRSNFQIGSRVLKKLLKTYSYAYIWHTM